MSPFLHHARRALRLSSKHYPSRNFGLIQHSSAPLLRFPTPTNHSHRNVSHITEMRKSAFRDNLLRILRTEIDYEIEMRHPREPAKKFNSFVVEDRPGRQYVQLTKRHGDKEDIKVEVTMFDGYTSTAPNAKDDDPGGDVKLHISLVVDVLKGQGDNVLQFICSAWPESLVIQKVFLYRPNSAPLRPFMGPDFKELDEELQESLMAYLDERGIDDDLSAFLHDYIANKDVCEHVRWMGNIEAYIEK